MRAMILAGLMVAGVAVAGEPTMAEQLAAKIAAAEKFLANGPAQIARYEAGARAAEARGNMHSIDHSQLAYTKKTLEAKQLELAELRKMQLALADPKRAAEMAVTEAKARVTAAEKTLAEARAALSAAEDAYRKAGGVLPGDEPK